MKKVIGVMLGLLAAAGAALAEPVEVTIHVDAEYVPFSYQDAAGQAKGMYVDVMRTAFSRMPGFKVKIEPLPWKRGKLLMENGQGVGLAPAFFHGHDWPYLHPYSLPFYTETIRAVCRAEVLETPRPNWPQDYKGLRFGNVAGFDGWGGEAFHAMVKAKEIDYEEAKSSRMNIGKLGLGRLDCIMAEETAFAWEFAKMKVGGEYEEGGKHAKVAFGAVIGSDPVYIGYSRPMRESGKSPWLFDFMQAFDSEIYKMGKAGEIQKIMSAFME